MLSNIHILIFAASVAVAFSADFCENGEATVLKCPDGSVVTGIQTTSEILSADATPVCTQLDEDALSSDATSSYSSNDDGSDSTNPKASCPDGDHAIQSISICFVDGQITEIISNCTRLKNVDQSNTITYGVLGETSSPELKCEEGSVLNSIKYDRNHGRRLIVFANCTALDAGRERVPVIENYCRDGQLVELACPDGYVISGYETAGKMFSPDVAPLCTKLNETLDPKRFGTFHSYYSQPDPKDMFGDCNFWIPVFTKFSMCFVDGVVKATSIECHHFQDNQVTALDLEDVEVFSDSQVLQCNEGSFVQGFSMNTNPGEEKYAVYCVVIAR